MGFVLADKGAGIVKRGGADNLSDDELLLLELAGRAPGLSKEDLGRCFVALRMEYGDDALAAIRSGAVKFEETAPQAPTEGEEPPR